MHIITFDIEDWFHTHQNRQYYSGHIWSELPARVEVNTARILDMLDELNLRATFFILGWVADHHPELVKQIQKKGHEIAAHSYWHHHANLISPTDFEKDLVLCLSRLQDITGDKVTAYRAPGYSLQLKDKWAFEILAANGISIDSSIQIRGNLHHVPIVVNTTGSQILEFPLLTTPFGFPYSGGGYFRVLPQVLLEYFFSGQGYRLLYFHPRDFDPENPFANMFSLFRNVLNSYNTDVCMDRLKKILTQSPCCTLGEAAEQITKNRPVHVK